MATRPAWRGYLKLSLVTCAVELYSATTQSEKISFRILNRATGNTVKRRYIDAETGKPVSEKNEVKGYEVGPDQYLLIEEEDLDAVQIESSHTLSLDSFIRKSDLDAIYLDTPYYLAPADEVSQEAFGVIRQALEQRGMAGLARIVLYRRERPVVIEPFEAGMLLTTLRYGDTVRPADTVFDGFKSEKPDRDMLKLAGEMVAKRMATFQPTKLEDRYEDALLDLIKAKKSGRKRAAPKPEKRPSNVVNLFDALRKSLEDDAPSGKTAAKPASKSKPAAKKPATKAAGPKRRSS